MKRVAVITSSDKGYRGEREDLSGPAVKEIMEAAGYVKFLVENGFRHVAVIDVYRYSVKILDCRVYLGLKCGI